MSLEVRLLNGADELEQVRRLRYRAFAIEQNRSALAGLDAMDNYSLNFIASRRGEIVGALRLTRRSDGPLEDEACLRMPLWSREFLDPEMFQASRFVVASEYRGSSVQLELISAAYRHARQMGARALFMDSDASHLNYYKRIGFRRFCGGYRHPYLDVHYFPLVAFIDDLVYYQREHCLLARLVDSDAAARARAFFERHVDPEFLFPDEHDRRFAERPFGYFLINDVLRREAEAFERRRYPAGEFVEFTRRVAIICSGSLRPYHPAFAEPLRPGDHFGELELLGERGGKTRARAVESTELMLMTRAQLLRQLYLYPGLGLSVYSELLRRIATASASEPQVHVSQAAC